MLLCAQIDLLPVVAGAAYNISHLAQLRAYQACLTSLHGSYAHIATNQVVLYGCAAGKCQPFN